jgi:SUKH-4 immunity protein
MLTPEDIEAWFPEAEVRRVHPEALPDGLDDPATRALLTGAGLPSHLLEVVEISSDLPERIATMDEVYRRYDDTPPAGGAALFELGHAGQSLLGVDGATGAVSQVSGRTGIRPLATSLEAFVRVLAALSRRITAYQDLRDFDTERFAAGLRAEVRARLAELDPGALPAATVAWDDVTGDLAANAEW